MKKAMKMFGLAMMLCFVLGTGAVLAEDGTGGSGSGGAAIGYLGAGIGCGLAAMGAGFGIGRWAGSAAEAIARQPSATKEIMGTQLAMFLMEGAAIIGMVFCLLIVLLK